MMKSAATISIERIFKISFFQKLDCCDGLVLGKRANATRALEQQGFDAKQSCVSLQYERDW
jgi:hypothetical protein